MVVTALLIRNLRERQRARQAEVEAERRAAHDSRMAPVNAYLELAARWELGTVEPSEVIAEVEAWRAARFANEQTYHGEWEKRLLREAKQAATSGVCAARDARTAAVREWWESRGYDMPERFDDILGQIGATF